MTQNLFTSSTITTPGITTYIPPFSKIEEIPYVRQRLNPYVCVFGVASDYVADREQCLFFEDETLRL